jgi:hypothetical protein
VHGVEMRLYGCSWRKRDRAGKTVVVGAMGTTKAGNEEDGGLVWDDKWVLKG